VTRTVAAARAAGVIGVFALALAGCSGGDAEPGAGPSSSPVASAPGKGNADAAKTLPARWWSWAAAAPKGQNPIADATGKFCARNQPDDVFFLAGTFGEENVFRKCTIPAGKPVYFPVVNQVCSVAPGKSPAAAIKDCRILNRTLLWATLNEEPLAFAEASSKGSFRLEPVPGNDLRMAAGDAVAWGVWVGPLKLDPGVHVLEITADTEDFSINVSYGLDVL
jgi:hypothetical protein